MLTRPSTRLALVLSVLGLVGCGSGGPEKGGIGENTQALHGACAPANTVLGIDISSYQHPGGAGIDWNAVAASRRFVIIKASEGSGYTNDYYAGDSNDARAHGMLVGAYHFLRFTSSGADQANHFLASVGGSISGGDLPPMLDVEETNDAASPGQRVQIMQEWLDTVQAATGRKPMIYSGTWYWGPYMGSPGGYAGNYPMVWAAYVSGCPQVPDDFPGLTMWQYAGDGATTPGIQGSCDQDMFYGSEAELMGLVDRAPIGWLDAAGCDSIRGWAQDQDAPTTPIDVHVYFGGPAGSGAPAAAFHADQHRDDLCSAIGSCEHGYSVAPPLSLMDGQPHEIHVYGIDQNGSANAELSGSPQNLSCGATLPSGVRRHVIDPTSFGAWKLDEFWDTLPFGDADIAKLATADDLPATPELVQADDGTPEVWVVDGTHRRHVPDPNVMAAWGFDFGAVQKKAAAEVYALGQGPDWRARPVLLHESSGAIWLVDDPFTSEPGSGTGGAGGAGGAGGSGGEGATISPSGGSGGTPKSKSGVAPTHDVTESDNASCSTRPGHASAPPWTLTLALAGLLLGLRARRARRDA